VLGKGATAAPSAATAPASPTGATTTATVRPVGPGPPAATRPGATATRTTAKTVPPVYRMGGAAAAAAPDATRVVRAGRLSGATTPTAITALARSLPATRADTSARATKATAAPTAATTRAVVWTATTVTAGGTITGWATPAAATLAGPGVTAPRARRRTRALARCRYRILAARALTAHPSPRAWGPNVPPAAMVATMEASRHSPVAARVQACGTVASREPRHRAARLSVRAPGLTAVAVWLARRSCDVKTCSGKPNVARVQSCGQGDCATKNSCTAKCMTGYNPSGDNKYSCTTSGSGKWERGSLTCTPKKCSGRPPNGGARQCPDQLFFCRSTLHTRLGTRPA
jgi:hypothetical protein